MSKPPPYRRAPCEGCPWRVDRPGHFSAERFRALAVTAYDASFHLFACHETPDEKPAICAGFLLRNAANNLAVRHARAHGLDMAKVGDGGHALHKDYRAMAVANGVAPDDPALAPCRGDDDGP